MKKPMIILMVVLSIAGLVSVRRPQAAEQQDKVKTFMQAKLDQSKNILEGLATENYELIAVDSQQLTLLSLEADWQVIKTEEYSRLSLAFRKTSQKLTEAAKKKNLDGATLAYVELTLKCVECHKYVRSVDMARLNEPQLQIQPQQSLRPETTDSAANLP